MLDLNSMIWLEIEQQEKYLEATDDKQRARFGGTVYKDHLVTLKQAITSPENALCFLNLGIYFMVFFVLEILLETKNVWSTFDIQGTTEYDNPSYAITGDLIIYKNMIISLTVLQYHNSLNVAMMNIESIYLERAFHCC